LKNRLGTGDKPRAKAGLAALKDLDPLIFDREEKS